MDETPSEYIFAEISIGQKKTFHVKITDDMINQFAKSSGDVNRLHIDDEYAKTRGFNNRICHGMLLSTFLSRLVGMYLPGKNALYLSQTLDFQLPCYVDDDITIQGEVKQKINATKTIVLETKIFNDSKECLVDGIAKVTVQGDE